jgi:hypothetical protein
MLPAFNLFDPMNKSLILLSFPLLLLCCNKPAPPDPRIDQLQKDVSRLADQNQQMESEIRVLRQELEEQKAYTAAREAQTQTQSGKQQPRMTVERAKVELDPVLKAGIARVRKQWETPPKGDSFGMRVNFDLSRAIYGLIRTEDRTIPYRVKVIVPFEKFLESENKSKSYGAGSTTFLFGLTKKGWVLEKFE